ncbi:MAG: class I SAM-dependent methyltransferase [Gammaproteobacteria bacterium]|jgi:SAM-dependent methyltransferase|nr:class I SAM-dependent methyltransferase [Gammaproteobacteria bacterium]
MFFVGGELFWDKNLGLFSRIYCGLFGVPISGLRIRLRRVLPSLTGTPEKVLDAGCGRGVFSYQLAKRFPKAEIVAVDIDSSQLERNAAIAAKAKLENVSFVENDISRLTFEDEFDLVLSVDNLEHLEDDLQGLMSIYSALKQNGRLVLHVPGYERRWFLFGFRTNFDVPGHFRPGYRLNEITDKVSGVGFTVESAKYTFGWLETVTNNCSYVVTRAEAKNKTIYALLFPLLNAIAWLGRNSRPKKGAGVLVLATKH